MTRPPASAERDPVLVALDDIRERQGAHLRVISGALAQVRGEGLETRALLLTALDGMAEKTRRHAAVLQMHDAELARMRRARHASALAAFVACCAAAVAWGAV